MKRTAFAESRPLRRAPVFAARLKRGLQAVAMAAVMLALFPPGAGAQPPTVGHALPAAALPGQATDLALAGANLASPSGLWTNIPSAQVELAPGIEGNGTKADSVVYRFTVPAETPVGIYGMRLATPLGISSMHLLMVDDLPSASDSGANKTSEAAQQLTWPVAVDGTCEAESYDFYRITAAAGQRMSVEAVARRLGSALDPVVRLLDGSGHELAYSDDEPGIGADCRFVHQFELAGDYLIEIRDIRYQGGATHRYRLRIGDFPLVSAPYPLAGVKGSTPRLAIAGPAVEGLPPTSVAVPVEVPGGRLPMAVRYAPGDGSVGLRLTASNGPEQVEFEPNDTPETSSPMFLAGGMNGRFEVPQDRDYFDVQAKQGQRVRLQGRTRSLGSPSDLFLRLYKADGSLLVEAEDTGTDEGLIDYTFPEEGTYRLMVEDLNRRGGPKFVYRIEVEPYQPGFALAVEVEKVDAPQAGVFVLKVTCVRRDYNGPITLSLSGIEGCTLSNHVIPEGQNEVVMNATLPPGLAAGQLHTVQVAGQAKIGETEFTARASTLAALRTLFNGLAYPPAELDGLIGLGIGPMFPDFFQLSVEPVAYPQVAGAATFLVKANKLNGFDDPIALAVEGLPAGVTATVAPIEKGKAEATVQLSGPGSLAEGEYTFRVQGSATFQNQPRTVRLDSAVLRVVKPLEVSAAPGGPIAPGAAQKLKVVLNRNPAAAAAVTVKLEGLPAGVTAPPEITIAEGQNEIEVDLTAAAEAAPGQAELRLIATTTINNKVIAVESMPVALVVAAP